MYYAKEIKNILKNKMQQYVQIGKINIYLNQNNSKNIF